MKKCPFKKNFIVEKYYTYGAQGFPMANCTKEEFSECIGSKCMAYKTKIETIFGTGKEHEVSWCSLCGKDPK